MAKEKESGPKDAPKEPPKETGKEPPKENPPPVQVVQSLTYCPWGDGYAGGPDQIRGHILGAHVKGEQPGTPTPVEAQATPTQPSRQQVESTGFEWEGDEGFRWGEDTPSVRLQEILQWMMVPGPLATYIGKYHARNKQVQNWLGLYNFLSGYKGFDVDKASHVATHVYGGQEQRPTIMGGPATASRSRSMGPPGEESQDSMDQTLDHTMRRLVRAIEVRNMAAVRGRPSPRRARPLRL